MVQLMSQRICLLLLLRLSLPLLELSSESFGQERGKGRDEQMLREELEDYFEKWLNEDVGYIISEDERSVFKKLSTQEEKEQFIEQFWFRRDPDPRTAFNDFKEEHYRRIAYANDMFQSGQMGWRTDRGRIYIIHGPPAQIESYPSGGMYQRQIREGGGTTTVYPFERWRYRNIEGLGSDIELEFVDDSFTDDYRLALNPEEKDALLHVTGAGLNMYEELGLAKKEERPYFSPGMRSSYPHIGWAKDQPFWRWQTFSKVQVSPEIKYQDLKQMVKVDISYSSLPFEVRNDYLRLNGERVLVPVTIEVQNKDVTFKKKGKIQHAHVAVYGIITSIKNRIVSEFEHDLLVSLREDQFGQALGGRSLFQKMVALDGKLRYKLDLIVKDLHSLNVGAVTKAIIPPSYGQNKLAASSLILSDHVRHLAQWEKDNEMFVLGDMWIRPSVDRRFAGNTPLGVYLQLYDVALDQMSNAPSLRVSYQLLRGNEVIREAVDDFGRSIQSSSDRRVILLIQFDLSGVEPGDYRVRVDAWDRIKDERVQVEDRVTIYQQEFKRASR